MCTGTILTVHEAHQLLVLASRLSRIRDTIERLGSGTRASGPPECHTHQANQDPPSGVGSVLANLLDLRPRETEAGGLLRGLAPTAEVPGAGQEVFPLFDLNYASPGQDPAD